MLSNGQPEKADWPIVSTPSGISMFFKLRFLEKIPFGTVFIFFESFA